MKHRTYLRGRLQDAVRGCVLGVGLACLAGGAGSEGVNVFAERPADVAAPSVELTLHGRGAKAGLVWPVTFGVPFPQGLLNDPAALRLRNANGEVVPIQVRTTARWLDDSIQWVLIDAQAPLPEEASTYRLDWSTSATGESAPDGHRISYHEDDDQILVDTGPLQVVISKRAFKPFDAVRVANEDGQWVSVFPDGQTSDLYLEDDAGVIHRGTLAAAPEVVVEEAGPQRVAIKAEGWMVSEQGERLGRRIVRIYAFAGQRTLRVFDTFVNTADTDEVRFANISLHLPFVGDHYRFHHASAGESRSVRERAYLLQHEHDAFEEVADGQVRATGDRAPGRVTVSEADTAYTVGWRHFWQTFPNEMEVAPGMLKLHFWPRHGKEAHYRHDPHAVTPQNIGHLRWVHEGDLLDFSIPDHVVDFDYPEYPRNNRHNVLNFLREDSNAFGVARTSEYWLDFHGVETASGVDARLDAFDFHPLVLADSHWMADSQAFWNIAARDERYEQVENGPERMLDFFVTMYDYLGDYGKWNYGAYHQDYHPSLEYAWIHRHWKGFHQGGPRWPWLTLVRSGDPHYFTFAEIHARHLMDVCMVHWEDPDFNARHWGDPSPPYRTAGPRKFRGGLGRYKALVHWAEGQTVDYNAMVDFALWYYYITGYQRAWDTAMLQGELLLRQESLLRQEQGMADASLFPDHDLFPTAGLEKGYFENHKGSMHNLLTPGRQGTGPGAAALQLYRATHDERYLLMAKRIMDHYRQNERRSPGEGFSQLFYAPFAVRYWEVTRDESIKPYIVRWARDRIKEMDGRTWDGRDQYYDLVALAYQFTGDVMFLKHGLAQTQIMQDNRFAGLGEPFDDVPYWVGLPSGVGYVGQQWGHFLRALHDHHETTGEWLMPPAPTEAYPFVSIVSSTKPGDAHQIVFHVRKEAGEAVNLDLRFNVRGESPVDWTLENPQGRQMTRRRVQPQPIEGRAHPTRTQAGIRVPLAQGLPAGDYQITLRCSNRMDVHWPYPDQSQYRKLVVEAPIAMGMRMGPPLRVFMPVEDQITVKLPEHHHRRYSTHRIYNPEGEVVFAQTGAGTANTPDRFEVAVPADQQHQPWFYRRSISQDSIDDLELQGIAPVWSFTQDSFFLPEKFMR